MTPAPKVCLNCGQLFHRRDAEAHTTYNRRKYCAAPCFQEHKNATRRREVLEEVQWLIGTDTPASIARRLGYANPYSLTRVLERWGRPDLARHFRPHEDAA